MQRNNINNIDVKMNNQKVNAFSNNGKKNWQRERQHEIAKMHICRTSTQKASAIDNNKEKNN